MIAPNETLTGGILGKLRELSRFARQSRIVTGVGYRVRETTSGTILDIEPGGGGTQFACYRLKSVEDDYVTVRTWNGTDDGASDILLAKPHKLRHSITSEAIEGVTYYYTYVTGPDSMNKLRKAWAESGHTTLLETQIVVPEWLADDIVYGLSGATFVEDAPSNLLMCDGRAWAKYSE